MGIIGKVGLTLLMMTAGCRNGSGEGPGSGNKNRKG